MSSATQCWTCVELLSRAYACASRNNVTQRNVTHYFGNITAETPVRIDIGEMHSILTGWTSNCASYGSMYQSGLHLLPNGTITGQLSKPTVILTMFNTLRWNITGILRLDITLHTQPHPNPPPETTKVHVLKSQPLQYGMHGMSKQFRKSADMVWA